MKQKFSFYVLLIVVIFNLISCSKQDVQLLPPETKTGAGTFACIYNGKTLILPNGIAYLIKDSYSNINRTTLQIQGFGSNTSDFASIDLIINDPFANNSFQLNSRNKSFGGVELPNSDCDYETDNLHQGIVEITNFDTINRIVSGRFSFNAAKYSTCFGFDSNTFKPNNNDVVEIGSGRFDLKMY